MPWSDRSFFDLYGQNFVRVAVAVPRVSIADPERNATEVGGLLRRAAEDGAALLLLPELVLSGYSIDDLHQQEALQRAVLGALEGVVAETRECSTLLIAGAPLRFDGRLFNCAVVAAGGRVLGVVPKSYLPNYREFYEKRQFAAARDAVSAEVELLGVRVPFGPDLLFRCRENADFAVHVEICEDLWVPVPPSTFAALRGATVLANLSASNVTIAKADYRRQLCAGQSARCIAAYLYAAAGPGESTTDLAWDGHGMIYEDGERLAEAERFASETTLLSADVDLDRLVQDRMRMTSFQDCAADHRERVASFRDVPFSFRPPEREVALRRPVERRPFVPTGREARAERCAEAYRIQVAGLEQRLRATGIERVVIGVSGGLDSAHALLVCARTMDRLGLPRTNVLACTMPGFATSKRTRENALALMAALGVRGEEIDIRPACEQMLRDIGHPFARGEKVFDVTFENVQAGERTSHLFRLANLHGALVVGTGDLSELALGWCTYGVGDHMSHYHVNASVPKTLIRHLIEWTADSGEAGPEAAVVLRSILATEISPELVPGEDASRPAQRTEEIVGPFDLHDFSLYYLSRRGYLPSKVAFLAHHAWSLQAEGELRYGLDEILHWLRAFLDRFFRQSQFKRSALPNGPKVGSGGSLSPRGDWRAPSDSGAAPWLGELDRALAWIRRSRPAARGPEEGR